MQPGPGLDNPGVCGIRLVTAIIMMMLSGADLIIIPPETPETCHVRVHTNLQSSFRAADTAGWTSAAGVRSSFVLSILNTLAAGLHRQASSRAPGHKWLLPDQTKTRLFYFIRTKIDDESWQNMHQNNSLILDFLLASVILSVAWRV